HHRSWCAMRKRPGHDARFVSIDVQTIANPKLGLLAIGLLAVLLHARDNTEVTLEDIAVQRGEDPADLDVAMASLLSAGYVVKFTIPDGDAWRSDFIVNDHPFTQADIAELLGSLPEASAIGVEPADLDPRPALVGGRQ